MARLAAGVISDLSSYILADMEAFTEELMKNILKMMELNITMTSKLSGLMAAADISLAIGYRKFSNYFV